MMASEMSMTKVVMRKRVFTKEEEEAMKKRSLVDSDEIHKGLPISVASLNLAAEAMPALEVGSLFFSLINDKSFDTFGLKNSLFYRKKLFRLMEAAGLNSEENMMVIAFAVKIKNRERIISGIKELENAVMFERVRKFYESYVVQYTHQENDKGLNCIAVVHIPSAVPHLSALAWKSMTIKEKRTPEMFLMNLWAAQMKMSEELMGLQLKFEYNFWDSVVKKGGKAFENEGFKQEYWRTKAADRYNFMNDKMEFYEDEFTLSDLKNWLSTSFRDQFDEKSLDLDQPMRVIKNITVEEESDEKETAKKALRIDTIKEATKAAMEQLELALAEEDDDYTKIRSLQGRVIGVNKELSKAETLTQEQIDTLKKEKAGFEETMEKIRERIDERKKVVTGNQGIPERINIINNKMESGDWEGIASIIS
jgi:hypothetical protein